MALANRRGEDVKTKKLAKRCETKVKQLENYPFLINNSSSNSKIKKG